jgi:hypothetical protein
MLLWIFGLIDLIAGISLVLPNFLGFYLGVIELLKGGSSIIGGIGDAGFVILGIMDVLAGIMLLAGFSVPLFWILFLIKGVFTTIFSISD